MNKHLSVVVSDSFVQSVLTSMKYPYIIVEESEPFDESQLKVDEDSNSAPNTVYLNEKAAAKLLESVADFKNDDGEASINLAALESDLQKLSSDITASRDYAKKNKQDWEGPSDSELKSLTNSREWNAAVHCSYLRVVLKSAPNAQIDSPITKIKNVKVELSATGELWVKHWWFKCTRQCSFLGVKYCCRWAKTYKWTRIGKVPVRGIDVLADARMQFAVEEKTKVVARPLFDKLRLDYDILREIQLEEIANWFMRKKDQKFDILKPGDISIDIDLNSATYVPLEFELPSKKGGIAVDAELMRL